MPQLRSPSKLFLVGFGPAHRTGRARQVLQEVASGSLDVCVGYRRVYGIYLGSSGLAEDLKPFFRLPGIEPDGFLHVDDEFRAMIRRLADAWLRGEWPPRSA